MNNLNGSTFIHFEEEEEDWRIIFEIVIIMISRIKICKFDMELFIECLRLAYEEYQQQKIDIEEIYF